MDITPQSSLLPIALPKGGRYMVTGGGTGGHVYPAIAIADEIRRRDPDAEFLYVGVKGRSEEGIVPRRGYPLVFVTSTGFPGGKNPIKLGIFALTLALGILKAMFLLLRFKPTLVIGTGGYVSAPVMLGAIALKRVGLLKAGTFIHEQNTFPGRLNRLVGSMVDCVGVSFPETLAYFPTTGVYVGYPVRKEMGDVDRAAAREALNIPPSSRVVFAFGGSQGARTINRALVDALPALFEAGDVFVIHGVGTMANSAYNADADTTERLKSKGLDIEGLPYLKSVYFHNIETIYAAADLVVCRAGAGTLTEVCARGLPALILPKAGLPGDHQVKNARALAARDGARVVYERADPTRGAGIEVVEGKELAEAILALLASPETLEGYRHNALEAYHAGALDRTAQVLAALAKGEVPDKGLDAPKVEGPDLEAMTPMGLVSFLRRRRRQGDDLGLSPGDLSYLRYRTDRCLSASAWQVRNNGVKLVGLLKYEERWPLLVGFLKDKTPVSLPLRLAGGDYAQVGFIRRNIFDAFVDMDLATPGLTEAIITGLKDHYFEVRSAAARCAAHFSERLDGDVPALRALLMEHVHDKAFDVQIAACRALGALGDSPSVMEAFRPHFFDPNWKVRQGVVQGMAGLFSRGVITAEVVQAALEEMLITSNGFSPFFPLKADIRDLGEALRAQQEGTL